MKGQVALVNTIIQLKVADYYMASFIADTRAQSLGVRMFKKYREKIGWVLQDILTTEALPQVLRDEIRREMNSDVLVMPALLEKISLLNDQSRVALEGIVDSILNGEKLTVETNEAVGKEIQTVH